MFGNERKKSSPGIRTRFSGSHTEMASAVSPGVYSSCSPHAGNGQRQPVAAERARGRQVAFPRGRRHPAKFQLHARVDVHRLRQRHPELVAAIAPGAAQVRHRIDEPLVADDLGLIGSGKDTCAAGVVGVRVGVDDRPHRRAQSIAERVRMARAATGSVAVSTMIDPEPPWIRITLLAEYPTATYTPSAIRITSLRNSADWARNFSRAALSCAAAAMHDAKSIVTASPAVRFQPGM